MLNRECDNCGGLVYLRLCRRAMLAILLCVLIVGQGVREAAAEGEVLYVKGSNVNIRSGPGTDNDIVAKVNRNHKMVVISRKGRWFQVKLSSGDGATGWIRDDLISEAPTEGRRKPSPVKPPSVAELSTPAGVVIALDKAPTERVVEAFRVAIGAAGQTCGAVTGMERRAGTTRRRLLRRWVRFQKALFCARQTRRQDGHGGHTSVIVRRRLAGVDLCDQG